jgi:hypothetical protein
VQVGGIDEKAGWKDEHDYQPNQLHGRLSFPYGAKGGCCDSKPNHATIVEL